MTVRTARPNRHSRSGAPGAHSTGLRAAGGATGLCRRCTQRLTNPLHFAPLRAFSRFANFAIRAAFAGPPIVWQGFEPPGARAVGWCASRRRQRLVDRFSQPWPHANCLPTIDRCSGLGALERAILPETRPPAWLHGGALRMSSRSIGVGSGVPVPYAGGRSTDTPAFCGPSRNEHTRGASRTFQSPEIRIEP